MSKTKIFAALCCTMALLTSCHKDIWNSINSLETRVETLETLCAKMNTNIGALQTIVNALQTNDMITNVSEIKEGNNVTGYTITFLSGKSITIHNGKDGADGKNGQDGETPVVSVKQDTDGVYYWTVNGSWLLDTDGNKIQVTGITPQLKIDDGKWYVSYDDGTTWETEPVGQATGDNGDSMFSSVTQDDNNVYFTLADGTVIKIAKGDSSTSSKDAKYVIVYDANGGTGTMTTDSIWWQKTGVVKACQFTYAAHTFTGWNTKSDGTGTPFAAGETIVVLQNITLYAQWEEQLTQSGEFTVASGKKVKFAPGNLQYTQSTKTWAFADNQYDYIGTDNVTGGEVLNEGSGDSKDGTALADKIDLFGWSANNTTAPWGISTSTDYENDYSGDFVDWGENIGDGNTWRTLTSDEWYYLLKTRANASERQGIARINLNDDCSQYVNGLILLPDSWTCPSGVKFTNGFSSDYSVQAYADYQTFTLADWQKLEAAGAVFLPAAGLRGGTGVYDVQDFGDYWSATPSGTLYAYYLSFYSDGAITGSSLRYDGRAVRLVQDLD